MSVVRLIVATRSSNILVSGKIIKEMPGSVASGTPCITDDTTNIEGDFTCIPRNDLFPRLLCAKLVGTNSDMHALTFQRKDDVET